MQSYHGPPLVSWEGPRRDSFRPTAFDVEPGTAARLTMKLKSDVWMIQYILLSTSPRDVSVGAIPDQVVTATFDLDPREIDVGLNLCNLRSAPKPDRLDWHDRSEGDPPLC